MRTAEEIKKIKDNVRAFYPIVEAVCRMWESPQNTMLSVIVQNIQFDGSDCSGYSIKSADSDLDVKLNVLRLLSEYNRNEYLPQWIYDEIKTIYDFAAYDSLEYEEV